MTDPVTRLSISHTHSFSVVWMIMLAYLPLLLLCTLLVLPVLLLLFRAYPHFRDFHTSLCGLLLVWNPLSSIRRFVLGTRLRCALEFRVVEFSRVSDLLRQIRYLRSDVNGPH